MPRYLFIIGSPPLNFLLRMVVFIRIHWEPPFSLDPLVQADNDHRLDEFIAYVEKVRSTSFARRFLNILKLGLLWLKSS